MNFFLSLFLLAQFQGVIDTEEEHNYIETEAVDTVDLTRIQKEKLIDINRASIEELKRLPISPEEARAIYEFIQKRGPLQSVYDLSKIEGLKTCICKLKPYIKVIPPPSPFRFSYYATRVRERAAREESPREAAFDEWISLLAHPININKADVDDLYQLDGVSLQDAIEVVKYAKMLGFRRFSHLRAVKGLSYYGYRNLRPYILFWDKRPTPVSGVVTVRSGYYSELFAEESSELLDRITELETRDTGSTMWDYLTDYGWDTVQLDSLAERLKREREESQKLHPAPYLKVKTHLNFYSKYRAGFLYSSSPYLLSRKDSKYYLGVEGLPYLKKFIAGNYHLTLDMGLIMNNTDEPRDRYIDKTGLFPDLTSSKEFALFGEAMWLKYKSVQLIQFFSKTKKDAILGIDGKPLFYYAASFVPSDFRSVFDETLYGAALKFDLPHPFPFGTQLGITYMGLDNSDLTCDFKQLDIPLDREDFSDYRELSWESGKKRFIGLSGRTYKMPVSLYFEYAKEIGAGDALNVYARVQEPQYYLEVLYRDYDIDYYNPYMRGFKEDNRFEYTTIERSYRNLDPLASNLQDIPIPKPERGIYVNTRYQPVRQVIIPRAYFDVWQNKASGLWNWRFQGEVEIRPIYSLRFRFKEKFQERNTQRYFGYSTSFTKEHTLRIFFLPQRGTFLSAEYKFGEVELTPKTNYIERGISGSAFQFRVSHTFSETFSISSGVSFWHTNGMSQWNFDDTGIDFLYGEGNKFFVSFIERLAPNLGIRLKIKSKREDYPHTGLFGQEITSQSGYPIYTSFVSTRRVNSIQFILDYSF